MADRTQMALDARGKALGMVDLPSFRIIAQDVKALHPEMVFANEQGHLVIKRQKLMQKDASVANW